MKHHLIDVGDHVTINQYPNRALYVVIQVQEEIHTGKTFVCLAKQGTTYVSKIKLITEVTKHERGTT